MKDPCSTTTTKLPSWMAVLDFLKHVPVVKNDVTNISIYKKEDDWQVKVNQSEKIKSMTKKTASRGVSLYDLYW